MLPPDSAPARSGTASEVPQSSQNADEGALSAPHFGQGLDIGLPQAAQNFLPLVLSVPHLVQRMSRNVLFGFMLALDETEYKPKVKQELLELHSYKRYPESWGGWPTPGPMR